MVKKTNVGQTNLNKLSNKIDIIGISYKDNKNRIKKKLSFFEGGHQLEKLEFALAIAQTNGDEKKSIVLRKKIVELGGNVEEPGT